MKIRTYAAGTAAALTLASVSAHAALSPPSIGTTAPTSEGLYLAIWDSAGNNTELVNLNYLYSDVSALSGNLDPTAPNSAFQLAAAPTGAGQVLQLNFGTIPQFSSLFTSANLATSNYLIVAQQPNGSGLPIALETTAQTQPTITFTGLNQPTQNIAGEIASWVSATNTGIATDTTKTATFSIQTGLLSALGTQPGLIGANTYAGQSIGSAVNFYNIVGNNATHKTTTTQYSGYWFLSSTGVLSYDVPVTGAPVPLPAAVWLFGSGLLGMAGIARRRKTTV